jgi:hypothetical protein
MGDYALSKEAPVPQRNNVAESFLDGFGSLSAIFEPAIRPGSLENLIDNRIQPAKPYVPAPSQRRRWRPLTMEDLPSTRLGQVVWLIAMTPVILILFPLCTILIPLSTFLEALRNRLLDVIRHAA